jgi:hypothetical protein
MRESLWDVTPELVATRDPGGAGNEAGGFGASVRMLWSEDAAYFLIEATDPEIVLDPASVFGATESTCSSISRTTDRPITARAISISASRPGPASMPRGPTAPRWPGPSFPMSP